MNAPRSLHLSVSGRCLNAFLFLYILKVKRWKIEPKPLESLSAGELALVRGMGSVRLRQQGPAGQFMDCHKAWIKRGFDDGVFLLAGNLRPHLGGGIVAHNASLPDLQSRVNDDPFVAESVVAAEFFKSPRRKPTDV